MSQTKRFDVSTRGDVTIVRLKDPRLHETILITELHDELLEYLETHQPSKVVVNFDQVTLCSTAVINSVLRAKKRLITVGGQLRLCGMVEPVRDAYRLLNLDGTVFEIDDTLDESVAKFAEE